MTLAMRVMHTPSLRAMMAGLMEILSLSAMKSPYPPRILERGVPLTREPLRQLLRGPSLNYSCMGHA